MKAVHRRLVAEGRGRSRRDSLPNSCGAADFGRRLRCERENRNLSQRKLAEELVRFGVKLDPSAIARIESGAREVKFREAVAIARAMDMVVDDLVPSNSERELFERFDRTCGAAIQHAFKARQHLAAMAQYFRRAAQFVEVFPEITAEIAAQAGEDRRSTPEGFLESYTRDFPEIEPPAVLDVDATTRDLLNRIAVAAVHGIVEREAEDDPRTCQPG